jgi:putative chitinase
MFTENQLIAAGCADRMTAREVIKPLLHAAEKFRINTPNRLAGWLAQCTHESSKFQWLEENLNYSAAGLIKTFPSRITPEKSLELHRQPVKIGNYLYGNRMGNLGEASGDGWNFRGRGFIQVTGRDNYRECGKALGVDLLTCPDLLKKLEWAALSAGWYWDVNKCNALADKGDIVGISVVVNLGRLRLGESGVEKHVNGLTDRLNFFHALLRVL